MLFDTRHRSICGLALAFALGLVACGDDSGPQVATTLPTTQAPATAATTTSAPTTTTTTAASTTTIPKAVPVKLKVGKTGWRSGFEITVDELEALPDKYEGTVVSVSLKFKNLTDAKARIPDASVVVDNRVLISVKQNNPEVPGGGQIEDKLTFALKESLDEGGLKKVLSQAQIVYGEARDNQTILPLSAAGAVQSIEPKKLAVNGILTRAGVQVEILGGYLEASDKSGENGKAVLSLKFKLSCGPDCYEYGSNVNRSNFSIKGASGFAIVADSRSPYCCEVINRGELKDNAKNVVQFVVPLPGTGAWSLVLDGDFGRRTEYPPAQFDFKV